MCSRLKTSWVSQIRQGYQCYKADSKEGIYKVKDGIKKKTNMKTEARNYKMQKT